MGRCESGFNNVACNWAVKKAICNKCGKNWSLHAKRTVKSCCTTKDDRQKSDKSRKNVAKVEIDALQWI